MHQDTGGGDGVDVLAVCFEIMDRRAVRQGRGGEDLHHAAVGEDGFAGL
jgi:hypothetical protein